eukprot:TRINITY_DN7391_c0_g1_i1.p1 TRINITY_DN7391_c0_g1~~TRINITY_DN7391_c0_g1_i1.p1  ORF type:complete len:340 (+),score=60.72 TRINITY_DN7391_c0_g1_i1:27-1046(+)
MLISLGMRVFVFMAFVALIATASAVVCQPGSDKGTATAICNMADGSNATFDLTGAFTDPKGNPYLSTFSADNNYIFYVTAINPGLNSDLNLPLCQFADGFTDSNSGAQAENQPSGGSCWSTGDINAETWTYDESSQTMTIESIEGQNDRKTKLAVVCAPTTVPNITTLPEDPPKEYNFKIEHNSACYKPQPPADIIPCQPSTIDGYALGLCQGNTSMFKLNVTGAFTGCDREPYLTTYATDSADKYYLSAIWPSLPGSVIGCTFSGAAAIVRQTSDGQCSTVGSSFSADWKYDVTAKTLKIDYGSSSLNIICSEDTHPVVSYTPDLQFQIHHNSVCGIQ